MPKGCVEQTGAKIVILLTSPLLARGTARNPYSALVASELKLVGDLGRRSGILPNTTVSQIPRPTSQQQHYWKLGADGEQLTTNSTSDVRRTYIEYSLTSVRSAGSGHIARVMYRTC